MVTDAALQYEIDVTRPAGQRIRHLRLNGVAVDARQEFIVATNNFRASGGGAFPGLDGSKTILASPDTNRAVLIDYIKATRQLQRARHGAARSWRFAPVKTSGPVLFRSAPGRLELARAAGLDNIVQVQSDDGSGKGLALYAIDLSK